MPIKDHKFLTPLLCWSLPVYILGYEHRSAVIDSLSEQIMTKSTAISGLEVGMSRAGLGDTLSVPVVLLNDRPTKVAPRQARDDRSEEQLGMVSRRAQLANVFIVWGYRP